MKNETVFYCQQYLWMNLMKKRLVLAKYVSLKNLFPSVEKTLTLPAHFLVWKLRMFHLKRNGFLLKEQTEVIALLCHFWMNLSEPA